MRGNFGRNRADRNARREIAREAVDTGRDRRKGNRRQSVFGREVERGPITARQQRFLVLAASTPHGPDRMNDVPGLEPIATGDLGIAGIATTERFALGQQFRPGSAMNRTIDATTAEQRAIGGIHDGIDVERRNVCYDNLENCRPNLGDKLRHERNSITRLRSPAQLRNRRLIARQCHHSARPGNGARRAGHWSAAFRRNHSQY